VGWNRRGAAPYGVTPTLGGDDVTPAGTLTVLLAGAGSGAAAGAIHQGLSVVLRERRRLRDFAFLLILVALTLRGLNPVRPVPLLAFAPVMALFAGIFLLTRRHLTEVPPRRVA
jgi:hypothetical protein